MVGRALVFLVVVQGEQAEGFVGCSSHGLNFLISGKGGHKQALFACPHVGQEGKREEWGLKVVSIQVSKVESDSPL